MYVYRIKNEPIRIPFTVYLYICNYQYEWIFISRRKCVVTCHPGRAFPDGSTTVEMNCNDGEWKFNKATWDTLPNCEGRSVYSIATAYYSYFTRLRASSGISCWSKVTSFQRALLKSQSWCDF